MTLGSPCVPECGADRAMMVAIGLLSFIGLYLSKFRRYVNYTFFSAQVLLTVSLQIEEAGKVSIMRKAGDILFAFVFKIYIFNVSNFVYCQPLNSTYVSFPEPAWDVERSGSQPRGRSCSCLKCKEDSGWSSTESCHEDKLS